MKIVKGNKILDMSSEEVAKLVANYKKVVYDIGTGDGRFIYKNAVKNPETLFVGVDPMAKQMQIYSKKAVKEHIDNLVYAIGSIELFPEELRSRADGVNIILPWGSLLKEAVNPNAQTLATLKSCFRARGTLTMIFGFNPQLEPSETARLNLEEIDLTYLQKTTLPIYTDNGFINIKVGILPKEQLKELESTWGKKISLTYSRDIFIIQFASQ